MCDGARLDPQPLSLNVHHTSFMLKKSKNLKRFVASYPEQCFILVEEERDLWLPKGILLDFKKIAYIHMYT